jgi:hypothetical protein
MIRTITISLSLLTLCINVALSQECSDNKVKIKMLKTKDGTTIFGQLVNTTDSSITINSNSLGLVNVPLGQVKSNTDVICSRIKNGDLWVENPSSNYYLIAPSAYPVGKRKFYYRNSFLFFNTIGYGVTDYFSINGAFDFLTAIENSGTPAFMLLPKFDFQLLNNLRLGTSFLFIHDDGQYISSYEEARYYSGFYTYNEAKHKSTGIVIGHLSYGNEDKNLSTSVGYNVFGYDYMSKQLYVSLAGFHRVSNRFGLQGEFSYLNNEKFVVGYGCRFITRKLSVDFGFITNQRISRSIFIGFPFVSFTLKN